MAELSNKIDFVLLVSVKMANPNGDPLNGNRPRIDYGSYGEITAECIKRKIRNRMQDLGYPIFVQSNDRSDDGFTSLSDRASALIAKKLEEKNSAEDKSDRKQRKVTKLVRSSMLPGHVKLGLMCVALDRYSHLIIKKIKKQQVFQQV